MTRLLCIGECMLELSPDPEPGVFRTGFAGDTFNTAWYARKLAGPEVTVAYLTAIGTDDISAKLEAFVKAAGIVPEFLHRPDRTIGLYMINLDKGERSFSYWRDNSAARSLADDLEDLPGLQPGDIAFFSGITLAILPASGRARLFAALARARARGVCIAFDPNLRPRLWRDDAEMCDLVMQGAGLTDIALPSFDDEARFFGDADPAACAARYHGAGAATVVVKDGAKPVLVHTNDTRLSVAPAPVAQIVDSTAAGDAFNAGFLVGLKAGLSPEQAARRACDVAGRVITQRGALVAP